MNTPTTSPTGTARSSSAAPLLAELEADLRIAQIERRTSWIDRVDATYWEQEVKRLEEAIATKRGHSANNKVSDGADSKD